MLAGMTHDASIDNPAARAVEVAGSQAALARMVDVSQPTVWRWVRDARIPAEHVPAVSRVTGIPRRELRPDIFGDEEIMT